MNISNTSDMELAAEEELVTWGSTPGVTFTSSLAMVWLDALLVFKHA